MSSYERQTMHPETGKVENAEWLDDFFGEHNYGVHFPSDRKVFRADEYDWKNDRERMCMVGKHRGGTRTVATTEKGKMFEEVEHAGGSRKDVTIHVNRIDVPRDDEATKKAADAIDEKVIPQMEEALKKTMVRVVVVHKDSMESASSNVPLPQVREFAEACIKAHGKGTPNDYIIVEVHHDTYTTRVSTLEKL